jgi:hypothetical protein
MSPPSCLRRPGEPRMRSDTRNRCTHKRGSSNRIRSRLEPGTRRIGRRCRKCHFHSRTSRARCTERLCYRRRSFRELPRRPRSHQFPPSPRCRPRRRIRRCPSFLPRRLHRRHPFHRHPNYPHAPQRRRQYRPPHRRDHQPRQYRHRGRPDRPQHRQLRRPNPLRHRHGRPRCRPHPLRCRRVRLRPLLRNPRRGRPS